MKTRNFRIKFHFLYVGIGGAIMQVKNTLNNQSKCIIPDFEPLFSGKEQARTNKKSRMLFKLFKANSKSSIVCIFTFILMNMPAWVMPLVTSAIIDLAVYSLADDIVNKLIFYVAILLILYLTNIPFCILNNGLRDRMVRRTSAGLKRTVIRRLQKLSLTYYKELESGKIQAKFLKDMDAIESLNMFMYSTFMPCIVGFIVSVCISISKSGIVTLFFLIAIPINVFVTFLFRKKLRKNSKEYRIVNENMSSKVSTMLEMIPITKAHGLEDEELVNLDATLKELYGKGVQTSKTNSLFGSTLWVVSGLFSAFCLVFCVILCMNGQITVGEVVLYQSLYSSISSHVSVVINSLPAVTTGLDAMNSISDIMFSDEIENDDKKTKLQNIEGNISFENVYYKYPNTEEYVIQDFSLKVNKGECIAFVGSSGSGKTTVMNMIIGFLKPDSGAVTIDGLSIKDIHLQSYRRSIAVVPQNSILFSGTIKENITYGMDEYSDEKLNEVIKLANIEEFLPDLPNGLYTQIGEHGGKLSGGQKQRITIARALIRDPKILILDEATSALDNISEFHVQQAISELIKGRTTFIVAHRLSTIRDADRIVVMENGKCVETGTYDELMNKRGKFFELKTLNDITNKEAMEGLLG